MYFAQPQSPRRDRKVTTQNNLDTPEQKPSTVFEDKLNRFHVEHTPAAFSCATSLSNLSMMDDSNANAIRGRNTRTACTPVLCSLALHRNHWRKTRNVVLYILACTHNGFGLRSRRFRNWWQSCSSQMAVGKRRSYNLRVFHSWRFHSNRTHSAHSDHPLFHAGTLNRFR